MDYIGLGPIAFYGLHFVFYVISYCVVIFFNMVLITRVTVRLTGNKAMFIAVLVDNMGFMVRLRAFLSEMHGT